MMKKRASERGERRMVVLKRMKVEGYQMGEEESVC
jgi:hypothetical protein